VIVAVFGDYLSPERAKSGNIFLAVGFCSKSFAFALKMMALCESEGTPPGSYTPNGDVTMSQSKQTQCL